MAEASSNPAGVQRLAVLVGGRLRTVVRVTSRYVTTRSYDLKFLTVPSVKALRVPVVNQRDCGLFIESDDLRSILRSFPSVVRLQVWFN